MSGWAMVSEGAARARPVLDRALLAGLLVLAAVTTGWLVTTPMGARVAIAGVAAAMLIGLGFLAPRAMLLALVVWLAALGIARRILTELTGSVEVDPLLLVAPTLLVVLMLAAAKHGAFVRTRMSGGVLALSALIVAAAINPLQGSVSSGLAGLLFILTPTLAFWVGRGLCDDRTMEVIFKLVAGLGIAAAAYGLWQSFVGFPSWDERWIDSASSTYASLSVLGSLRPFSSFSAAAEYGFFVAMATVIWLSFALRARQRLLALPAIALLLVAAFFQSSRGIAIALIVAIGVVAAARRRLPALAAVAIGTLSLALLIYGAKHLSPFVTGDGSQTRLAQHQVEGLSDPLDPEKSTLLIHVDLVRDGFRSLTEHPVGVGLGPVTIAGQKFGGLVRSTEVDPSNVAVALGLPGLIAYAFVFFVGLNGAYAAARRRQDALSLAALGILMVTLFQWLNGGQYAVAFLPWLVLGWLDRRNTEPTEYAE